jgi:benzylsuccinate CoA-transferase BbsE subunit
MGFERPYDGLRVIDLTGELSAYSTRLFADLGAEVIMVEPVGGRPERHRRIAAGVDGYGDATFAFFNASKKSVVADWRTPDGSAVLRDLVERAQIVVLEPEARTILPKVLEVPGHRVVTVVSPFGLNGPYGDYVGSDLVAQSLGGIAWLSGVPGEPPLRLPGDQSSFVTSVYAATATALALWDLEMRGHGHLIDVSAQECIAHSLQNAPQVWDLERRVLSRGGEGIRDATEDLFACQDGHAFLAAPLSLPMSWRALLEWMKDEGDPGHARLSEPDWQDRALRATVAMKQEFRRVFERFIADKTREDIRNEALSRKIVMAPVSKVGDLADDPQLIFRRYFVDVVHPALGRSLKLPGAPYRMSEPVWRINRAAPRVGQDDVEILGGSSAAVG